MGKIYWIGACVVGVITFFSIWFYAFASWGFLIGLAIGWLPAIIGAVIGALIWPLVVLVGGWLLIIVISS